MNAGNGSKLLGALVFYRINKVLVHKDILKRIFSKNSLNMQITKIQPHDAMRRCFSIFKNEKIQLLGNKEAILDITETADKEFVYKHISRKKILNAAQKIEYSEPILFKFNRSTKELTYIVSDTKEYDYTILAGRIMDEYDKLLNYHNEDTLRNMVNRYINNMNPTPIKINKGDSVAKFIPYIYIDDLSAIQNALDELKSYHTSDLGCSTLDTIELFDSAKNSLLLDNSIKENFKLKIDKTVQELSNILSNQENRITPNKAAKLFNNVNEIQDEMDFYKKYFNTSSIVLKDQLNSIMSKIKNIEVA